MLKYLEKFKGPFFKKDGFIDYVEAHSFILGVIGGLGHRSMSKSFETAKKRMDHPIEYHYFGMGYRIAEKGKWGTLGGVVIYRVF